jgi:chemotaxis signal transduction protein
VTTDRDHARPAADAPDVPVAPPAADTRPRAQAIECGHVAVAVPYRWARSVVESFEASPAPNAPAWLLGAVNVEGRILPVLDLAAWLNPATPQARDRHSRLLVCGDGEDAYALLFRGLPVLARCDERLPREAPDAPAASALTPFIVGEATPASAGDPRRWPVIDAQALARAWADELAV